VTAEGATAIASLWFDPDSGYLQGGLERSFAVGYVALLRGEQVFMERRVILRTFVCLI
jgi:hypothetical protein